MIAGDMLTEAQRRCIPDVSFELIPIRNLVSNQEYQRPLSENHIRKALEEFDVYQINPVKVSRRDGINYVFDGQHTIEIIASESGSRDTPVWCMIYDDLKYKEESHIFADQQKHVKGNSCTETAAARRTSSNKQPPKHRTQDRAALGAFLCIAGDGRGAVVRQAKDIIGTGMVEAGKLDQHLGGDIPLAGLVIGVADLCAFQIRCNILLQQITILPQIPDTLIHGVYLKGFIQGKV